MTLLLNWKTPISANCFYLASWDMLLVCAFVAGCFYIFVVFDNLVCWFLLISIVDRAFVARGPAESGNRRQWSYPAGHWADGEAAQRVGCCAAELPGLRRDADRTDSRTWTAWWLGLDAGKRLCVSSVCPGSRSGIKVYTIHKRCWCPVPWYSARHQSKLEGRGLGDSMSHGVPVYLLAYARISFTAWRQRQMCINNLPRVILERKPVGIEPAISNLESNALITACC